MDLLDLRNTDSERFRAIVAAKLRDIAESRPRIILDEVFLLERIWPNAEIGPVPPGLDTPCLIWTGPLKKRGGYARNIRYRWAVDSPTGCSTRPTWTAFPSAWSLTTCAVSMPA